MLPVGLIWPLEAIPTWLLYISYCLPMTFAGEAMRSILGRGNVIVMTYFRYKLISLAILFSFPNPLTSAPLSLYSHLAQHARLPLSHFTGHPSVLASNSLAVLSSIHATTFPQAILSNSPTAQVY
jgi:hypothetical protein